MKYKHAFIGGNRLIGWGPRHARALEETEPVRNHYLLYSQIRPVSQFRAMRKVQAVII